MPPPPPAWHSQCPGRPGGDCRRLGDGCAVEHGHSRHRLGRAGRCGVCQGARISRPAVGVDRRALEPLRHQLRLDLGAERRSPVVLGVRAERGDAGQPLEHRLPRSFHRPNGWGRGLSDTTLLPAHAASDRRPKTNLDDATAPSETPSAIPAPMAAELHPRLCSAVPNAAPKQSPRPMPTPACVLFMRPLHPRVPHFLGRPDMTCDPASIACVGCGV